jgi:hypothetical protein
MYASVNTAGLWIWIDSIRIQIQHFSSIRIRIHKVIKSGSNADPDPQHALENKFSPKFDQQCSYLYTENVPDPTLKYRYAQIRGPHMPHSPMPNSYFKGLTQ